MAAEASFILRAVDSTKAAFASVQNSLGKLRNESEVAGGFFKKAFDLKHIGMGLAVSSGITLAAITDKALGSITEYLTRFDRINEILDKAAASAALIFKKGLRDRMTDEEKIAAITTEQVERQKQIDELQAKRKAVSNSEIVIGTTRVKLQNEFSILTEEEAKQLAGLLDLRASEVVLLDQLKRKVEEKNKAEDTKKQKEDAISIQEYENRTVERAGQIMKQQVEAMKKVNDEYDKSIELKKKDKESLEKDALAMRMLINPSIEYQQTLVRIGEAFDAGLLTQPEKILRINRAISDLAAAMNKPLDNLRAGMFDGMDELYDKTHQVTNVANDMGFAFASAFESAVLNGEKAGSAMKALARDIMQVFLRLAVTNQIINAIFGASGLGLGGKGFQPLPTIGTRANGGSVSAGSPYLVGERGPELFVPKGSGAIMPNGAGGTSVNITYNIASGVSRSDLAPILEQQRKLLKAEIPDMVRRGGGYRAAFA